MKLKERKIIAECTQRLELDPYDAVAYHQRALAWLKLQEYEEAIADCNKVIQLKMQNAKLYYHKGLAYIGLKNYNQAIENLSKAISLDSQYAVAYNNRGQAYAILQEYQKAVADFSKAIALEPQYTLAYRNRATVYHVRGEYESALVDYEKTLSLDPNDKLAYFNRSTIIRILDKQGRTRRSLSQATTVIENDLELDSRDNDKISWQNLGIILGSLIFTFFFVKLVSFSRSPIGVTTAEYKQQNVEKQANKGAIDTQQEQTQSRKETLVSFKQLDTDTPQGMFNYGGSTVWAPIRAKVDKKIESEIPGFKLRYVQPPIWNPSSTMGIKMLIEDRLSIVQSSRPLTSSEKKIAKDNGYELKQIAVAIDGIAIAVHPDLKIKGLTVPQLRDIYSGKITNWKEVGGPDLKILPYSKSPHASGTASYFTQHILNEKHITGNVKLTTSTTEGLRIVNSNPGAIFYESAAEIIPQCSVRAIPVGYNDRELVSPYEKTPESPQDCLAKSNRVNYQSFQDASYPLTNKLYVIVKQNGQIEEEAGFAYAKLLLSEVGQKALQEAGFVAIR